LVALDALDVLAALDVLDVLAAFAGFALVGRAVPREAFDDGRRVVLGADVEGGVVAAAGAATRCPGSSSEADR
jgi:hypothetical protein